MTHHTAMFVSSIKERRLPVTYHSVYLAMSVRKRLQPTPVGEAESNRNAPRVGHEQFPRRSRKSHVRSQQGSAVRVFFINEKKD